MYKMKRQIAMSDKSICIAVYINICTLTLYRNFNMTHYMLETHHFWDKSMNVTQHTTAFGPGLSG